MRVCETKGCNEDLTGYHINKRICTKCRDKSNLARIQSGEAVPKKGVCQYEGCGKPIAKAKSYCGDAQEFGTCSFLRRKDRLAAKWQKEKAKMQNYTCTNCSNTYKDIKKRAKGRCGSVKNKTGCAYKLSVTAALDKRKKAPKYEMKIDYRTETIVYELVCE